MTDIDRYLTDEVAEKAARAEWESEWPDRPWEKTPDDLQDFYRSVARASLSAVLPDIIQQAKAEAIDERAVKLAETSIHVSHVTGQALSRCVDLVEHIAKDEMIREAKAEAWGEGHATGCADPYAKYGECDCGPNPYREGAES